MRRGRKLSEKSLEILKNIYEQGSLAFAEMKDAGKGFGTVFTRKPTYSELYGLKSNDYLQIIKGKNNQSFFHLTGKGKLSVLKYLHLEKIHKGKWDKHWRVIIFDVPESLKKWRGYLRNHIKELGFYPLQKSVYITPYPVTGELDEILKEWGLRKYFRYLTVTEIDGGNILKREFNLR